MDLTDLWQEHKKFILAVVGALVLLLVGEGVISGQHPVSRTVRSANSVNSLLRRSLDVADRDVRELEQEVAALRERLAGLVETMDYRHDDLFQLPAEEPNPTAYCWKRIRELQTSLVDVAERSDIEVPERIGLDDTAPTDLDEIRRTLWALDIVNTVVLRCIEANVREILRIQIESQARGRSPAGGSIQELEVEFEVVGYERSLRRVLASLLEDAKRGAGAYLEVKAPTRVEPYKYQKDMVLLRLTVAGLSIPTEELELASR
jgi:hypothetical protein